MKPTLFALSLMVSVSANATIFHEVEPNNTLATANQFTIASNDRIQGSVFGFDGGDSDYFRLTTTPTSFALYKNTLNPINFYDLGEFFLEGMSTGNQAGVYYSFGAGSPVTATVSGLGGSLDYTVTYYRERITPIDLGTFQPGNFRFQEQNSVADFGTLDFHIFDGQGRIVPGGWNTNQPRTFFDFSVDLAPGTYLALAGVDLRSEAIGGSIGNVMGGNVIGAQAIRTASITISTATSAVTLNDPGLRLSNGPDYVVPYTFTVVPEPASFLALGVGLAILGKKRCRR